MCVHVGVCVCVCVSYGHAGHPDMWFMKERHTHTKMTVHALVSTPKRRMLHSVCVCVCVRERERERLRVRAARARESAHDRDRTREMHSVRGCVWERQGEEG